MTIFKRFFKWVGKTVATVTDLFKSGKVKEELERVIKIVNVIKKYADSPITLIIVKATPFLGDDIAREWLSRYLTAVLDKYNSLKDAEALRTIAGTLAEKQTGLPLATASLLVEETYQESKLQA